MRALDLFCCAGGARVKLSPLASEVLALVTDQWQGQRAIVWAVNGPRETTLPQAQIEAALADLARKRLIESRGRKTRAGSCGNNRKEFRLRTAAQSAREKVARKT